MASITADLPEGQMARQVQVHTMAPLEFDSDLVVANRPDGDQASAYRLLAHQALRWQSERKGDDGRERSNWPTILVTSPQPGSGKSVCAANLALAFGERSDCRPVLVELNVQYPSLGRLFRLEVVQCLREVLEAKEPVPLTVTMLETVGLAVAAVHPDEPGGRMRDIVPPVISLLTDLRAAGYGPIVCDGPATLGSADANVLLDLCDGALVVGRAGEVRARDVDKTRKQLGEDRLIGMVLLDR